LNSELDEEMQSAVQDYLERRGVNDDLAAFLHAYMENKEHNELTRWLKNVEYHVKQ
jgi:complement component 1 Q subcomponent-binding protein